MGQIVFDLSDLYFISCFWVGFFSNESIVFLCIKSRNLFTANGGMLD